MIYPEQRLQQPPPKLLVIRVQPAQRGPAEDNVLESAGDLSLVSGASVLAVGMLRGAVSFR
jgi:hypothetical protein